MSAILFDGINSTNTTLLTTSYHLDDIYNTTIITTSITDTLFNNISQSIDYSFKDITFSSNLDNDITETTLLLSTQSSTLSSSSSTTNQQIIDYDDIFSWQGLCLVTVFCIFIVITIIGNTLVILAVITTRRLRTVTNCFVMSLAVADLLVGMFVMPPAVAVHLIGSWQLGWVLCDIWISLDVLVCTASILSLCAISVDRYLAVTQPLTYSRKRRSKRLALIMILIVWSLALAITCPPILGWYEPGRRDLTECRYNQNEGYVIFSAMGSFFIPMIVMIYVYARISCVIASRHDNMTDISVHNKKNKKLHTVDLEADQDTSEQDVSPNQKKKIAARTLSNQTIGGGGNEINDIIILDDNGIVRQQTTNKNGSNYELVNTSRTSSFKRHHQHSLNIPKNLTITTTTGQTLQPPSPSCNIGNNKSSIIGENWSLSYGNRNNSIRSSSSHHHQHHTTCINSSNNQINSGNDTYVTRNTRIVHNQKSLSNRISSLKKENKTTQTLSIVVGGFIACWLPFFIYYLITPFLTKDQVSPPLSEFLTWLGWFNSAINPFIYAFYSVDFRAAFWRLTLKRFFRNSTKGNYPSNTMSIRR